MDWSSGHGAEQRLGSDERYRLIRYQHFREAAARVAAAFGAVPAVTRVALFGSVASSPSIESRYGRDRFHEPKDVDLAVWVDGPTDLDALRKLAAQALNRLWQEMEIGVAHHQVDTFLLDVRGEYFGRLCHFNQCPKHKPQCRAEGCGRAPFLQQHDGFVLDSDALAPGRLQILYDRL